MSSDLRVLVVDDQPLNRRLLKDILEHLGCVVTTAQSGADALSASRVGHFDLICLDRHMPGLSGDEVAAALPSDQFVLAWSTDVANLPERFNGALSKPVSIAGAQKAIFSAKAWRAATASPVDTLIRAAA